MKRVGVIVSGRVQGVFYRTSCAGRARELGVAGFVRNMPDGRVEAAFEGPDEAVEAMVDWCRRGSEWAEVDGLELRQQAATGEAGFRVTG